MAWGTGPNDLVLMELPRSLVGKNYKHAKRIKKTLKFNPLKLNLLAWQARYRTQWKPCPTWNMHPATLISSTICGFHPWMSWPCRRSWSRLSNEKRCCRRLGNDMYVGRSTAISQSFLSIWFIHRRMATYMPGLRRLKGEVTYLFLWSYYVFRDNYTILLDICQRYQIACSAAEVFERYSTQTPEAAQIVPSLPGPPQAASRGDWFVTSELRRINGCSKPKAWLGRPDPKQEN